MSEPELELDTTTQQSQQVSLLLKCPPETLRYSAARYLNFRSIYLSPHGVGGSHQSYLGMVPVLIQIPFRVKVRSASNLLGFV